MKHACGMMDNWGNKHTLRIFNTEAFHGNNVSYKYAACLVHFGMAFWQTMGPNKTAI